MGPCCVSTSSQSYPLCANCSATVGLCALRNMPNFGFPSRNCFLNSAPLIDSTIQILLGCVPYLAHTAIAAVYASRCLLPDQTGLCNRSIGGDVDFRRREHALLRTGVGEVNRCYSPCLDRNGLGGCPETLVPGLKCIGSGRNFFDLKCPSGVGNGEIRIGRNPDICVHPIV